MSATHQHQGPHFLPGFQDYSTAANDVFRTCLEAMSRPGRIIALAPDLCAPSPLLPTSAAILLTLADFETTYWTDLIGDAASAADTYLRFHSGARRTDAPAAADFALITDVTAMPRWAQFKTGTLEYPDRSTTIICQVRQLAPDGHTFSGPGIKDTIAFRASPEPPAFRTQLSDNRATFPCGVDLLFATETHIASLPRSAVLIDEV
jgi:alpha-D-ribose 1-methylphosphonate 5-triphosphate synthase subunit PhnH